MNTLIYTVQIMNNQQKEDTATLEILQAIDSKSDVTQRHLASKLDVALGLANSYLKRCVSKGLVKIQQAPANRYFYYLTPKGFAEKSRLTTEYLSTSFDFYRKAGDSLTEVFSACEKNGKSKIVFCGISELAEIASLRAYEFEISILGTLDTDSKKETFLSLPVWGKIIDIPEFDVCLITSLEKPRQDYDLLINSIDKDKIMVPSILGINQGEN
ncbi:MAG: winged helix-turn-helix transcriptional regulator [Proteobacteria bacterium]|nr:winged helix-turn-helix transcriptional regulator [Pseudomonadota bacterium]